MLHMMGVNKSYDAIDAYSNGLEDPFGPASVWGGAAYYIKFGYNHTVNSYQLDWEHQTVNTSTSSDYYKICIYGYISPTSEEFSIQVWDHDLQDWEDWGTGIYTQYWQINGTTPQWYNYSLYQNIYSNITWRYTDNSIDSTTFLGDSVQHTLHIDYAGVFAYNISIDVQETSIGPANHTVTWDDGTVPKWSGFVENPIHLEVWSGVNYSIRVKGQSFPDMYLYASNTSDPETNGAVYCQVWGTGNLLFENMPAGHHVIEVWMWVYVPPNSLEGGNPLELSTATVQFSINAYT